jgi:hypothetical protein
MPIGSRRAAATTAALVAFATFAELFALALVVAIVPVGGQVIPLAALCVAAFIAYRYRLAWRHLLAVTAGTCAVLLALELPVLFFLATRGTGPGASSGLEDAIVRLFSAYFPFAGLLLVLLLVAVVVSLAGTVRMGRAMVPETAAPSPAGDGTDPA